MELYILNTNYEKIAVIDEAESILWNKKYNDVGECEIYIPCSEEMLSILREDYYIFRYDDDMFCQIKKIEINTDVENGDYIIATATDICNILAGRIIRWQIVYSGTVAGFIEKILNDNVINPAQTFRRIDNLMIDKTNFAELTETINISAVTDDLLQLIISTCNTYNYGFRVSYNIKLKKLVFKLYKGKDKSTSASGDYVEFSPQFANILSSTYKQDASNYKNVAYVGYKNSAGVIALLSLHNGKDEPSGENRKEIYVDGTGLSRDIKYEELQELFAPIVLTRFEQTIDNKTTGFYYFIETDILGREIERIVANFEITTTDGEESEKITVTDYTYLILIKLLGQSTLADRTKTQEFSGNVDTINTYRYKSDYDLGDFVKVINDYGISARAQITEVMESEDNENGYQIEPKYKYLN